MAPLPCMNCNKPVPETDAKIFGGVFCCPACFTMAESLLVRLDAELRKLQLMTKEAIRVALVQGKLHYGTNDNQEVPKAELLKMIVQMAEKKDASKAP